MNWISSEGGPLLLLSIETLHLWGGFKARGIRVPLGKGEKTDYDRACEIAGYIGIIPVGGKDGLVLGDEPMETTWIPYFENKGGIFVRWEYAEKEETAIEHAKIVPSDLFESTGLLFHVSEPTLYLFDSAIPGKSLKKEEALVVELNPGTYRVETAPYKPDEHTALVIHRLVSS